jgi:pyrimidine operon attenuation protein/uracil phosphoribosyltransferase
MATEVLTFDDGAIAVALARIADEIRVAHAGDDALAIIGIRTGGAHLAHRLRDHLADFKTAHARELPLGVLDITLYRDDVLVGTHTMPVLRGTDIPFDVEGKTIILVDDVLYTGRTIRAALDAILDHGRPRAIRLAVLVDRGLRELPIAADFCGFRVSTRREDRIEVRLREEGIAADAVVLLTRDEHRATESARSDE